MGPGAGTLAVPARASTAAAPVALGHTEIMAPAHRVFIVNSNEDVVDMLRMKFEHAGWSAATAHVVDAKRHRIDLPALIREHDAAIIVYDVAPPYDENWQFLQGLRARPDMAQRAFVITTTNQAQLNKIAGPTDGIEIIGKPFDLDAVLARATAALDRIAR
jgi:DNA-binding response OmpR family regulator